MDSLKTALFWPQVTIIWYFKVIAGIFIVFVPYIWQISAHGSKSLDSFVDLFNFLRGYPFGLNVYAGIISLYSPYTGSIYPFVRSISSDGCHLEVQELPWLRNPFGSIHAIVLANLGEAASGIMMMEEFKKYRHLRGIPTEILMEYKKKARGRLTGVGRATLKVTTFLHPFDR
jgi:hypothetical protein